MDLGWNHRIKFPLRLYLKQLFFGSLDKVILSPNNYWYIYQIEFLEKCWQQNTQQQLEDYLYDRREFYFLEQYWIFYWIQQLEQTQEQNCREFLESCWLQE